MKTIIFFLSSLCCLSAGVFAESHRYPTKDQIIMTDSEIFLLKAAFPTSATKLDY